MAFGLGFGLQRSTIVGIGAGTPPVNTVAPVVSGTPVVGETLSCTTGTWTGTDPITYSYQWKRNGVDIGGATNNTYLLVQADAGNTANISCTVTATNDAGETEADSNTIAQIFDATWWDWRSALTVTDTTINNTMNTFMIARKAATATPSIATYGFVTDKGTNIARLTDFGRNLWNPANSDAAKRISWSGVVTATQSAGGQGNGSTGMGVTYINPSTDFPSNDFLVLLYVRSNQSRNEYDFGACDSSLRGLELVTKFGNGTSFFGAFTNETTTPLVSNPQGLWSFKRSGNTITIKLNFVTIYSGTISESFKPNFNMNFMCWGRSGSANALFSSKIYSHLEILDFAPDNTTETNLGNAIVAKETSFGRNVV